MRATRKCSIGRPVQPRSTPRRQAAGWRPEELTAQPAYARRDMAKTRLPLTHGEARQPLLPRPAAYEARGFSNAKSDKMAVSPRRALTEREAQLNTPRPAARRRSSDTRRSTPST